MATRKGSSNKKKTEKGLKTFDHEVLRAKEVDSGDILFDAKVNEVTLYGMAVKKGDNGEWISFPARKSGDKYYKYYYLNLTDEQIDELIQAVFDKLDE